MNWEHGRKLLQDNLRHYRGIYVDGQKKMTKKCPLRIVGLQAQISTPSGHIS
jgi:hypothetical protein